MSSARLCAYAEVLEAAESDAGPPGRMVIDEFDGREPVEDAAQDLLAFGTCEVSAEAMVDSPPEAEWFGAVPGDVEGLRAGVGRGVAVPGAEEGEAPRG